MDPQLQALEDSIEEAEAAKRAFVKENPTGTGDNDQRIALYNNVERARKALRAYKKANALLS